MQFYSPEAFLFLWSVPVLIGIFWFAQASWKRRVAQIGNADILFQKLMPTYDRSSRTKKMLYLILVFVFATMALARPQWGEEKRKIERKGIDLIFALDTSLSMLAEDAKPNRLEKSKLEIKNFLRQLKGDRVGMVAFAGSSFLQSPLTLDYAAFQLFVDAVQPGYIPDPGTSLSQAITLAIRSFPEDNLKHKAIIAFTDGEDHEGEIDEALKLAKKSGVRIYTIGLGSEKGDPIPLKDESGRKGGYKKDRGGQIVITKLNPQLLQKIAQETGALYMPSTPGEQEVSVLIKHMGTLDKRNLKDSLITEKEDHYQGFLILAFLFLCLEKLVRQTKKIKPAQMMLLMLGLFLHTGFLDTPKGLNNKANDQFKEKKYQSAVSNYRQAQVKNPDDPTIRYNLGTALYQVQEYNQASQELEKTIQNTKDKELLASALYNYGNTQYRLGNFEKAIESYQKVLELNPADKDAKYNLEFLQNQKSMFDKKNENKQDPQKQPKNQQQQNQQQNQQNQQNQQQNQQSQQQNQQGQQQDQQQNQGQGQQNQQGQQQDQQQNQGQGQQDKQEQQAQQQEQNQQDSQDQQNQDQKQEKGQQKDEQEKQSQNQDQQNQDQKTQDQKQNQEQQQQKDEQQQDQQSEEMKPQDQQDQQTGQGKSKQPLQGQMPMNDALRILDALKDSEKDLQDLRRPPVPEKPRNVEKDW